MPSRTGAKLFGRPVQASLQVVSPCLLPYALQSVSLPSVCWGSAFGTVQRALLCVVQCSQCLAPCSMRSAASSQTGYFGSAPGHSAEGFALSHAACPVPDTLQRVSLQRLVLRCAALAWDRRACGWRGQAAVTAMWHPLRGAAQAAHLGAA